MSPEDAAELALVILNTMKLHGTEDAGPLVAHLIKDIEGAGFRIEREQDRIPIRRNPT